MGARNFNAGGPNNKRKLSDRTKDKDSKKPKFEKRPQRKQEPDDFEEDEEGEDFSDDAEDGGAPVISHRNQARDGPRNNGYRSNDTNGAQAFEKGTCWLLSSTH
jgi:hypothetical protein